MTIDFIFQYKIEMVFYALYPGYGHFYVFESDHPQGHYNNFWTQEAYLKDAPDLMDDHKPYWKVIKVK